MKLNIVFEADTSYVCYLMIDFPEEADTLDLVCIYKEVTVGRWKVGLCLMESDWLGVNHLLIDECDDNACFLHVHDEILGEENRR